MERYKKIVLGLILGSMLIFTSIFNAFDVFGKMSLNSTHYDKTPKANGRAGHTEGTYIDECQLPAFEFMNCPEWLDHVPNNEGYKDYNGTTVIIDSGMTVDQWKKLEYQKDDGVFVDIIKYVRLDPFGKADDTIGDYGRDELNNIENTDLGFDGNDHGYYVTSAFSSIARGAKVIFIDVDLDEENKGFSVIDVDMWQWILDNVDTYDIDIINMSFSAGRVFGITASEIVDELINQKGVFMVSSIGNDGIDAGYKFPGYHPDIYTAGSVDHETRGKEYSCGFLGLYTCTDPDYYSRKYHYTGSTDYADDNGCESENVVCSSYGPNNSSDPRALDFVMPGNGVPIPLDGMESGTYRYVSYRSGTSYSSPYTAAAALIAVFGFNIGFYDSSGYYKDPNTASSIYSVLKGSASNMLESGWHYRYGWGYIDLGLVYDNAYDLGYAAGIPDDGGGGSCPPEPIIC